MSILKTVKEKVSKKVAILLIAGGVIAGGGIAAQASSGLFDTVVQKTVAIYVQKVDTELDAYAQQKKDSIPGFLAERITWFNDYVAAIYKQEVDRGKKEIDQTTEAKKKEYNDEVIQGAYNVSGAITKEVDKKVAEKNAEITQAIDAEAASRFKPAQ